MLKPLSIAVAAFILCVIGLHFVRVAAAQAQSTEQLLHKEASFDLLVPQPYDRVAPLFGADGERAWGGSDWDPHFLFPSPARDVPGAVFTVERGGHKALWITPIFDLEHHHIQHWILIPDAMVTQIEITFPERLPRSTRVHVVYTRTALSPSLNEHVAKLSAHDASASAEWQKALDSYFAKQKNP